MSVLILVKKTNYLVCKYLTTYNLPKDRNECVNIQRIQS